MGSFGLVIVLVFCLFVKTTPIGAEQLQSPHYLIDESAVGTSDMSQSSSANYKATNATGALSIGNASSSSYQVEAGTKTTPDPALSFNFIDPVADFGVFTSSSASMTTASFSVSNYTSYGYVVQITGSPLKYNGHTISAMSETGSSVPGDDQFGLNLVANTSPMTIGANPDNGQFGYGAIAPNYATANRFRFVSGETIAQAPKSSGKTIYTLSYLVNVKGLTPGGQYTSNQTIIITGTY